MAKQLKFCAYANKGVCTQEKILNKHALLGYEPNPFFFLASPNNSTIFELSQEKIY